MININEGYDVFCRFLEQHSGISLGANKQYLVASRLRAILQKESVTNLADLTRLLEKSSAKKLKDNIIDAMTTNETLWFRDVHPFRILKEKILPEWYQSRSTQTLRIWSAACSTGQEPYSISMMIEDYKARQKIMGGREEIIATDISPTALATAKAGEYAVLAIGRGLDDKRLKQHFIETEEGRWKVKENIARRVTFSAINLQESYARLGQFDVVYCRNVLIYFTAELKEDILRRIHASLKPTGYLVVGASEAVSGLNDLFEMIYCRPGIIYRKRSVD